MISKKENKLTLDHVVGEYCKWKVNLDREK